MGRKFNWRKFRREVTPELYCYLRENYWKEITKMQFYIGVNRVLYVQDCLPEPLRRYGDTLFEVYDWMKKEYEWFDGRTPRQRYNKKST